MRKLVLLVTLAVLAGPHPLHAKTGNSEVDCVNAHAAPADVEVVWLVQRDHRAPTAAESAAMDRFTEAARGCATQYGWTETRTVFAVIYALGQVIYEGAVRELAARGIAPGFLERVAADLGERGRRAILSRDPGEEEFIGSIVARDLAEVHAPVRSGSPELLEVGHIVGRGVAAMLGRDQALQDFAAP